MNQKFKIKLVAIAVTTFGAAWNSADAKQNGAGQSPPQGVRAQAAEQAWGGAFGTVQEVTRPNANPIQSNQLPPIVTSSQRSEFNLPPIVSKGQANQSNLPPIVNSNQALPAIPPAARPLPETIAAVSKKPLAEPEPPSSQGSLPGNSNMLSPLKRSAAKKSPATSSAGVAQATMAPTDSALDSMVAPAAQWQQAQSRGSSQSNGNAYQNAGFSSAGIPMYAGGAPARRQDIMVDNNSQGVVVAPPIISPESRMVTPIDQGTANYQPDYAVDNYSQSAPAPTYFNTPSAVDSDYAGCQDCASGAYLNSPVVGSQGAQAACPSCGPNGCFDQNSIDSRLGYFGAMSMARRYVELDALYMTRSDGDIVLSNFGGVGRFDGNAGFRGTIGERYDATQGREISYFGTTGIEASRNLTDPAGRLSALFTPSTFFANAEAEAFNNAEIQNQRKKTFLHSVEFNRVNWGWDVVKSFYGIRYIFVEDSYDMFSQNTIPATFSSPSRVSTGDYNLQATNHLIGLHMGRELFYDVGYRLSFSGLGKVGVFANINEFEANASGSRDTGIPSTPFVNNKDNNATLATALEIHLTGHYQLNRRARLRMGYQGLMLDNVASVSDNLSGSLSPFLGTGSSDSDTMYFHGVNFGLEFYR